jgi:ubiquinone/menaquinone biosynthesis C-methylase UbiE
VFRPYSAGVPPSNASDRDHRLHQEWDPAILDALAENDFYASYKRRLRELQAPRTGGRHLDVGAGSGQAALLLSAEWGVDVVAVDRSARMVRLAASRGLPHVVIADAHHLPFAAASFDGVSADRVLQHLDDAEAALDQLIRVLRPGGRLVLADPDYDMQALDIEDQELARRVLRYRADVMVRNGASAHRQAGRLVERRFEDVAVEARTIVVRRPGDVDNVLGLRGWAHHAVSRGHLPASEAERFVRQFDRAAAAGRLTYALTFLLTSGRAPG